MRCRVSVLNKVLFFTRRPIVATQSDKLDLQECLELGRKATVSDSVCSSPRSVHSCSAT